MGDRLVPCQSDYAVVPLNRTGQIILSAKKHFLVRKTPQFLNFQRLKRIGNNKNIQHIIGIFFYQVFGK